MHGFAAAVALAVAVSASADAGYRLSVDTEPQGDFLSFVPHIDAPPGTTLRYELRTSKRGRSGLTDTSQSGTLTIGESGTAALSRVSVNLGEKERCEVTVRVYQGDRLVASRSLRHP